MLELALWLKKNGFRADQVQAFLPSPMATATAMYHSGQEPAAALQPRRRRGTVPKGLKVRRLHKAFLRYHDPEQLAAAARGAAAHGPRRSDRQRPESAGARVSAGGDGGDGRRAAGRGPRQTFRTQHTGLPRNPRSTHKK